MSAEQEAIDELRNRDAYECGEPGCDAGHVALYADERDLLLAALQRRDDELIRWKNIVREGDASLASFKAQHEAAEREGQRLSDVATFQLDRAEKLQIRLAEAQREIERLRGQVTFLDDDATRWATRAEQAEAQVRVLREVWQHYESRIDADDQWVLVSRDEMNAALTTPPAPEGEEGR